jgi:hypothetical protein
MRALRFLVLQKQPFHKHGKKIAESFHTRHNRNPSKPKVTFNNTDICYKSELEVLGIYIIENLMAKKS